MKKIAIIAFSVLCAVLFTCGLVACGGEKDSYTITVQSVGGAPLKDVTVELYNGSSVAKGKTDNTGNVKLEASMGEYEVRLSGLPAGYEQPENTVKTKKDEKELKIELVSHVIQSQAPTGYLYHLGDVMYDFTVNTSGGEFKLSEVIEKQQKRMVLINFWATWCGPCTSEFPYMSAAYTSATTEKPDKLYKDQMEILAISVSDSLSAATDYKNQNGLTFEVASDSINLKSNFNVTSSGPVPTSIIIDRYGVICSIESGAIISVAEFTQTFDKYISDDYTQDNYNKDPSNPGEEIEKPKPDVPNPESSVLEAALNANGFNGTYRADTESSTAEYSWPFLVETDADGLPYAYNSNRGKQAYSFATLFIDFHAQKGQVLAFDYYTSVETDYDYLYIMVDNDGLTPLDTFTGITDGWKTYYAFVAAEEGDYSVVLLYNTDERNPDNSVYTDEVRIRNVRFATVDEIAAADVSRDILYPCASQLQNNNDVLSWANYVAVGYSDPANGGDGYYHLLDDKNQPNGPYVLANMMFTTSHWSNQSLYSYAYNGLCVFDGVDYNDKIIEYSSYASYSNIRGYVPVTKELHDVLVLMAQNLGANTENEWLEMCSYYLHYGTGAGIADKNPIRGIAPFAADELHETTATTPDSGLNTIELFSPLRGIYYSFTPTTTAVYKFTSKNAQGVPLPNGTPTKAQSDPMCWIEDTDGNEVGGTPVDYEGDFVFYIPMKAGVKYYVRCCFSYPADMGSYQLGIENVGESVSILTPVTLGGYTYDLKIAETLGYYYNIINTIPDSDLIKINDENEWVVMNKNGTEMSNIYLDMTHGTNLTETSIKNILNPPLDSSNKPVTYIYTLNDDYGNPIFKPDYKPEDSKDEVAVDVKKHCLYDTLTFDFSKNGTEKYASDYSDPSKLPEGYDTFEEYLKAYNFDFSKTSDYTNTMKAYLAQAEANEGELKGMMQVDTRLANILEQFAHRISGMRQTQGKYIEREWLMMCYYYQVYSIADLD